MALIVRAGWIAALLVAAPIVARAEPGTHFLIELHGGIAGSSAEYLDLGWTFGSTIGIGGKLRGFPPRFYAVGSYRSSFFSGEGSHWATGVPFDAWEADHELTAGLRVVLPLWSRVFRWFGEIRGGSLGHTATLDRHGQPTLQTTSWGGVFALGTGVQARWHPNAAFGAMLEWTRADRDLDVVSTAAGYRGTGNDCLALVLSNTWFF